MDRQALRIEGIPAVLWGSASDTWVIAVHGDQSHKEDTVIRLVAEAAEAKGHQTLSVDLPEHGDRKEEPRLCSAEHCVEDLWKVGAYARGRAARLRLFGCSMGAYFGMVAYREEPLQQALFLSPVVDMGRLIRQMMEWFQVSEAQLQRERVVATPAKALSWQDYQYVLAHPVQWTHPTALLYGARDNLCTREDVQRFAERSHAKMTVMEDGEHYFHTEEQLAFFRQWLQKSMLP